MSAALQLARKQQPLSMGESDVINGLLTGGVILLFRGYVRWIKRGEITRNVQLYDFTIREMRQKGLVDCVAPFSPEAQLQCFAMPPNGEVCLADWVIREHRKALQLG